MKQPLITITFDVEAGKFESDGEKNCKYCCTFDSAETAVKAFQKVDDYPYAELDIVLTVDGATTRINLLGGVDRYAMLRFDVARLWIKATGQEFVAIDAPLEVQLDDIEAALTSARPTWQVVKRVFDSGALSWTEAFETLMSECGHSMEEALQLLAEHFDRRPVIDAFEAKEA